MNVDIHDFTMPEANSEKQSIFESEDWWDEDGSFAILHRLNPTRLKFIKRQLCNHFSRGGDTPLAELKILDIGCGGGLVSEPMARLGADVTGIDEAAAAIAAAEVHGAEMGLKISYLNSSLRAFAGTAEFDAVLALEVLEHVSSPEQFLAAAVERLKPNGMFIASTINRSGLAFVAAIGLAEYLLRLLPVGTHKFADFITPSELGGMAGAAGLSRLQFCGMYCDPLTRGFRLSASRMKINYLMSGVKSRR